VVLTVSFVISPVIGLCCHRRLANMAGPRPVGPTSPPQNLTPASRRQDHTTSPSVAPSFVCALRDRSRVGPRPAITIARRRCRVHRIPCPTSVTIAKRPFVWDGMAGVLELIWAVGEAEYFSGRGWTTQITLIQLNKFACARTPSAAEFQPSRKQKSESSSAFLHARLAAKPKGIHDQRERR
jgi:hypothetical protein